MFKNKISPQAEKERQLSCSGWFQGNGGLVQFGWKPRNLKGVLCERIQVISDCMAVDLRTFLFLVGRSSIFFSFVFTKLG